jgi:ribosomal protein S18 acetylase RimI-like enzyme
MVRKIKKQEIGLLNDFLYEAIYIPEGAAAPPRDIILAPELQVYVEDFGIRSGDICFVAEEGGRIIGAAWVRIMNDYGHMEEGVPSWAISVHKEYRGQGIGTELMKAVLKELKAQGYDRTSLSVQKENPAWHLYKRLGFEVAEETDQEYLMILNV